MKHIRFFLFAVPALLLATLSSAQTADEIIANYLNALGGKDQIKQINSVFTEGTLEAMGSQGAIKTTLLNGKGYKQEIDVMGTVVVMCYTDTMGWQINPMGGNYNPEKMADSQYKPVRDMIFAGGPFSNDLTAQGYQVELIGQEMVGMANAYKINIVSPDNFKADYFFDPATWYLIKSVQTFDMMGQSMDVTVNYSNYQKPENGYAMPFTMETNYGGQFFTTAKINKVEINPEIDPAIFVMP